MQDRVGRRRAVGSETGCVGGLLAREETKMAQRGDAVSDVVDAGDDAGDEVLLETLPEA